MTDSGVTNSERKQARPLLQGGLAKPNLARGRVVNLERVKVLLTLVGYYSNEGLNAEPFDSETPLLLPGLQERVGLPS